MNIENYLKAGYPLIYVVTHEPDRAIRTITTGNRQAMAWDCCRGIIQTSKNQVVDDIYDPLQALRWLTGKSNTVLFANNYHRFMANTEIIQELQNSIPIWKSQASTLCMVGLRTMFPQEIERFFTLLPFRLPGIDELTKIQEDLSENVKVPINEASIEAALGLTEFEAETAMALSLILTKSFNEEIITQQKQQMIQRTGLMEFWLPVPIEQVGGLESFKGYLFNRKPAFSVGNTMPKPKAILLVGIPGTGKSLSCKAAASILGFPLIRLDVSTLKGSLVGQSEYNMRRALQMIDAFGKAVVWLDEIDKSFSGIKDSGVADGGTTASMFGYFLTWLQETTSPILVMATANNIQQLPPEFMRAGRFDAIFFVDVPTTEERAQIIGIMNERYGSAIPIEHAERLQGWTGAEIEQLAKDSLFDGLDVAFDSIVPLSKTMKEDIMRLQDWAKTRARKANTPEPAQSHVHILRKVESMN